MPFVDTNIFIRYLTKDDPAKAQACFELFQQAAANQVALTTTEAVITEVVYVLSSQKTYGLARADVRARLYPLLSVSGLRLPHRQTYLRALDLYTLYPLDFEDAVIVAQMERQKINELYSYDQGFDRVASLTRHEP
ncbi:MAG: PIN domain-containing protein [Anaerolineae bacterium]|nr:PIN domain-containing protein [Anaerolineae bacterium]